MTIQQNYLSTGTILEAFGTIGDWTNKNPSAGTITSDATNFISGTSAIKLTATTNGGEVYADKTISMRFDGKNKLEVWVYLYSPIANYQLIQVYLTSNNFSSYFINNNTGMAVYNMSVGWNRVIIDPSDGWTNSGNENWGNLMTTLRVKMRSATGKQTAATFGCIKYNLRGLPRIVLGFDDASKGVYDNAYPYMASKNLRGVTYVVPSLVGSSASYCSLANLTTMYAAGWDISNHTYNHLDLTTVTETEAETEIQSATTWLLTNGFTRSARHLAVPNGQVNANVTQAIANSNLKTARNSVTKTFYPEIESLLALPAQAIVNTNTAAQAIALVDDAMQKGKSIIFMFHDIQATETGTYVWATSKFQSFVDYLVERKVPVVTINEWYNGLTNPRCVSPSLSRAVG